MHSSCLSTRVIIILVRHTRNRFAYARSPTYYSRTGRIYSALPEGALGVEPEAEPEIDDGEPVEPVEPVEQGGEARLSLQSLDLPEHLKKAGAQYHNSSQVLWQCRLA